MTNLHPVSDLDIASFKRDGYLVIPGLMQTSTCEAMKSIALKQVEEHLAPVEYEVDVGYPGAPKDAQGEGGDTVRRLLHIYSRHELFREWARSEAVKRVLSELFASHSVELSQCHHNCMMTKHPGFSSATLWHQDNRYWSFDEENLISVWTALGAETRQNGCLRVIPGSHRLPLVPGRFDAAKFLRSDIAENKALIAEAKRVELQEGDTLFFHSRLFHAAGRNLADKVKFSLVYTYHEANNRPIEGTRSARFPGILI